MFSLLLYWLLVYLRTLAIGMKINPTLPHSEMGRCPMYVTYTAAVLEYEPYNRWTDGSYPSGIEVVRQNALAFRDYAKKAKQLGADILITLEYGIQSLYLDFFHTEPMISYAQYVPHPADKISPFSYRQSKPTDSTHTTAIVILSEAAADNKIYIVTNLLELVACSVETIVNSPFSSQPLENCPKSGYVFYNTQVVFDRNGVVIARYRKRHLYLTEGFYASGPRDSDSAVFVTDFDVAFSLQIGYDAMFTEPGPSNVHRYGIKDIAMSTAWVDAAPYFMADQVHNGFARGLGINLLVSGHHLPETGLMGSGFYKWFKDEKTNYIYDKDSGDLLLVANVSTVAKSYLASGPHCKEWEAYRAKLAAPRNLDEERKALVGLELATFDTEPPVGTFPPPEESADGLRAHYIRRSNVSHFTVIPLPQTKLGEQKIVNACNNNFCCELKYSYNGNKSYKLFVDGVGPNDCCYKVASSTCSVAMCPDEDDSFCTFPGEGFGQLGKFGPFKLSATYSASTLVYPETLSGDYQLLDKIVFDFNKHTKAYSLRSELEVDNVLVIALFGRDFVRDTGDFNIPDNLNFYGN